MSPLAHPDLEQDLETSSDTRPATPWQVVLSNDPVNTTDYVTAVLTHVLKVDTARAEHLMMTAHVEGKVAVHSGEQQACADVAAALQAASLWAHVEPGSKA